MINFFGKSLVVMHTGLALIALAFALGSYFSVIDWGWKEPRFSLEVRGEQERKDKKQLPGIGPLRIASEIDKRTAALNEAAKARNQVLPAVARNQAAWRASAQQLPVNHLVYAQVLAGLRNAPGKFDIKALEYNKNGEPVLDPPNIGMTREGEKVTGINQSYQTYLEDLKKVDEELDKVTKDTLRWIAKTKDVTFNLTGKDDAGKPVQAGIYELIDREFEEQKQAKFENEYLVPRWARALEEAELFRERREVLEETLTRLKNRK